jgi:hypothetical protein
MKKIISILLLIIAITACNKTSNTSNTGSPSSTSNTCSSLGTVQDTIVDSGTKYSMIASSGASNVIAVEFIYNGTCASNLAINSLQAKNGTNCFESSNVTTLTPPSFKAYSFGSFPAWAIDTNTSCVLKVSINSTVYYLRDKKLNK